MSSNVFELPAHGGEEARDLSPADWARLERNAAEIFSALGLDLDTPGTRDTPQRFIQALYDATAGYDGDSKLRTLFPSERPQDVEGAHAQIIGPHHIGSDATIGAATVIQGDIPEGVLCLGNPARVVIRNYDNRRILRLREEVQSQTRNAAASS